jgi:hypothetical protein
LKSLFGNSATFNAIRLNQTAITFKKVNFSAARWRIIFSASSKAPNLAVSKKTGKTGDVLTARFELHVDFGLRRTQVTQKAISQTHLNDSAFLLHEDAKSIICCSKNATRHRYLISWQILGLER